MTCINLIYFSYLNYLYNFYKVLDFINEHHLHKEIKRTQYLYTFNIAKSFIFYLLLYYK